MIVHIAGAIGWILDRLVALILRLPVSRFLLACPGAWQRFAGGGTVLACRWVPAAHMQLPGCPQRAFTFLWLTRLRRYH